MCDQQISLRSVDELRLDEAGQAIRYFIPAYQRGYRWSPTQVRQLLEDLREFTLRNPPPEEFYCLQPLVLLARGNGAYEVVDGQQRLTTLLLILRHFNERQMPEFRLQPYTLEYATRPNLDDFLRAPNQEQADRNIDFFHIFQAINTIEAWFTAHRNELRRIEDTFLNNAMVIWFQLAAGESPVAAFTRLNVGKISLTNGELIRALFLRGSAGEAAEARRLRIAYEWDLVEKALQDPAFWAFLRNETGRSGSRIDFLFDLAAREQGMVPGTDDYETFNHFAARGADPAGAWLKVKQIYMLLAEWFDDRHLFHLVGFLIWAEVDVNALRRLARGPEEDLNALRRLARGPRKSELKKAFRVMVVERAFRAEMPKNPERLRPWIEKQLDDLVYPHDRGRIRSILLLFNLATLLQHPESNIRFHFESFKTARWDIEHVRSVAAAELGSPIQQSAWLRHNLGYLQNAAQEPEVVALQANIEAHLARPEPERVAAFEPLYAALLRHFREDDGGEPDNSIANLALLDQETNRGYRNAVFAVKRQRVLELDEHGVFVPHCTRNVFLKCYSPQVDHTVYWTQADRDGYRQALIDTLHTFIAGEWIDA